MKLDLTRQTFTQTFFYSTLVIFIYWGVVFIGGDTSMVNVHETNGVMPIGEFINNFATNYTILGVIAVICLQLFNALYISRIFIRNVVYAKQTHVASLLFILISISSPATNQEFISQFVTTLTLLSLEMVLSIKKRTNSSRNFFLSSLLISIAGLLYLPAVSLFLVIIALFFIYRRFNFREVLASLGGVLIPPFLYSYYFWITQEDFLFLINNISTILKSMFSIISIDKIADMNIYSLILIGVISIVMIFSLINFIVNIQTTRSRTVYSYSLFWVWMLVTTTITLLFTTTTSTIIPLCAVSVSVIISFLFNVLNHKVITNIIFVIFVILAILTNIL